MYRYLFVVAEISGLGLGNWGRNGMVGFGRDTIGPIFMNQQVQLDSGTHWVDGSPLPIRTGEDLSSGIQFVKEECWGNKTNPECISVHDRYLWVKPAAIISELVFCKTSPCLMYSKNLTIPWEISSYELPSKERWASLLLRIISPEIVYQTGEALPDLTTEVEPNTLKYLWYKPIFLVFDGTYKANNNTISFRAEFPISKRGVLNGIFGQTDLCKGNSRHWKSHVLDRADDQLNSVQSFFCPQPHRFSSSF